MEIPNAPMDDESIGQLIDRLSQLELHRWNVERLLAEPDLSPTQVQTCQDHLEELQRRRSALQRRITLQWRALVQT